MTQKSQNVAETKYMMAKQIRNDQLKTETKPKLNWGFQYSFVPSSIF